MTTGMEATSDDLDDLWSEVVGQDQLVAQLRRAAADPTHAYLFVGAAGVGTRAAAATSSTMSARNWWPARWRC